MKKETKGYVPGGENVEGFDEEDISLTTEGKVRLVDSVNECAVNVVFNFQSQTLHAKISLFVSSLLY